MDNIRLRDYFAGLAMQSLLSNSISGVTHSPNPEGLAKEAYLYADAMISISIIKIPPPKPTPLAFKLIPPEFPRSNRIKP
jgi:hypothetical protein